MIYDQANMLVNYRRFDLLRRFVLGGVAVLQLATVAPSLSEQVSPTAQSVSTCGGLVSVKAFGAKGDAQYLPGQFWAAEGDKLVTASDRVFSKLNTGQAIIIPKPGLAGGGYSNSIADFIDEHHIRLRDSSPFTLSRAGNILVGSDDATNINAAISFAKQKSDGLNYASGVCFPAGNYLALKSINLTDITKDGFSILGFGAWIRGAGSGPVVDAMHSRFLRWEGLSIFGEPATEPRIGLQIGRTQTESADNHSFSQFTISGFFALAALLNVGAETTEFHKTNFFNAAPNSAAVIMDGMNHWNVKSQYWPVTEPANVSFGSFNENTFISCIFSVSGLNSVPLWIAAANRMKVVNAYASNIRGETGVLLYASPLAKEIPMLDVDMHFETASLNHVFSVTGTSSEIQLSGFRYRDHSPSARQSIFAIDPKSPISKVIMPDIELDIAKFPNGTAKLINDPTKWWMSGRVYVPEEARFNAVHFDGTLCAGLVCSTLNMTKLGK